jgi:alkanesulfonate monooxygenase SsuD/methylene tetrahydromethanopterin reductase-like flavin-dependent oxidoreductase (luciferase family)
MGTADFAHRVQSVKAATRNPEAFAIGASLVLCMAPDADFDAVMANRYGPVAGDFKPATLRGSIDQVVDGVHEYVDAGADWVIIALRPPFLFDELERFANEVMPQFAPG